MLIKPDDQTIDQVLLPDDDAADFLAERLHPRGVLAHSVVDGLNAGVRIARDRHRCGRRPAAKGVTRHRRRGVFHGVEMGVGASGMNGCRGLVGSCRVGWM